MGYYVTITKSTFTIPAENLQEAYERMCRLNFTVPNCKKSGNKTRSPEFGPDKNCWFSWMDWNYHEKCEDAESILKQLAFEIEFDYIGNLGIRGFDSKTGQEYLFLESICDLASGYIIWRGEDGEVWGETYGGKEVITKTQKDYMHLVSVDMVQEVSVELLEPLALPPSS